MEADTAVTFIYLLYFSICLKSHELFQCRCIGTVITYFMTDCHNRQFLSISLLSERTDIFFIYTKETCLTQKMSIYLSTVQLYRKVSTNSSELLTFFIYCYLFLLCPRMQQSSSHWLRRWKFLFLCSNKVFNLHISLCFQRSLMRVLNFMQNLHA